MYFKSKKLSLVVLGITALVFSRALFLFFNDPEGPNLLVVVGTAVLVYGVSLVAYLFSFLASSRIILKRFLIGIFLQLLVVAGLYFGLK